MVFRVYSDNCVDLRAQFSHDSWMSRKDIIHINILDHQLPRKFDGLPYLKDILDIGYNMCKEDDDIILYTNTDIGIACDVKSFPKSNFFCIRKNVENCKKFTQEELSFVPYENSVNCDVFGVTKKWYEENRENIPDFLIGSPTWDLCMLLMMQGFHFENAVYHIAHESPWKKQILEDKHCYNKQLYINFLKNNYKNIIIEDKLDSGNHINLMYNKFNLNHLVNPLFITFFTPSHELLYKIFYESFKKNIGSTCCIAQKKHHEQICKTAVFHKKGWRSTQIKKFHHIYNVVNKMRINNEIDRIFVFCDTDIIILDNFIEDLKLQLQDCDLIAQQSFSLKHDNHMFCSGFFAGKPTKKVIEFLEKIYKDLLLNSEDDNRGDQYYMNLNSNMLNIKPLSVEYFNPGCLLEISKPVLDLEYFDEFIEKMPPNLKLVHANFILKTQNKCIFLEKIKKKYST